MYFQDALRVLLRRWYILVVGAVLVIVGAITVIKVVPTQYQASSQLFLILPPQASGAKTPTNPYVNLQPGLTVTASLIAGTVTTKESQLAMVAAGYRSQYSVALNPGTGPLLVISAEDTNPQLALATRDQVVRRLTQELTRIQVDAAVPQGQVITAKLFADTKTAESLPGSKLRALAVVGAGGIVLTLLIAFGIERAAGRRGVSRGSRHNYSRIMPTDSSDMDAQELHARRDDRPHVSRYAAISSVASNRSGRLRPRPLVGVDPASDDQPILGQSRG